MNLDFDLPELINLSLKATFGLLFILGLIDIVYAVGQAIRQKVFDAGYLTAWLLDHVMLVWFPIFALAIIGHGVPAFDVPAIKAANLAAQLGLVAYAGVVIKSLVINTKSSAAPERQPVG